jgi:hypothetical protein
MEVIIMLGFDTVPALLLLPCCNYNFKLYLK